MGEINTKFFLSISFFFHQANCHLFKTIVLKHRFSHAMTALKQSGFCQHEVTFSFALSEIINN